MIEFLRKSAQERKTILCFGVDPDLERIARHEEGSVEERIVNYYSEITDVLIDERLIAALKPNYAFFAQYGFEGLNALRRFIERYKFSIPIILDAKRGDIEKSSQAYAREIYEFWGVDAVTVSPYMGFDSVKPFLREKKLPYLLCRTTNPGANDFQELKVGKERLYEKVARKAVEWKTGLVIGATSDAIARIVKITKEKEVPFLIPGIGAQGGDLKFVVRSLQKNFPIHRINASSSIAFAYEKRDGSYVKAAVEEAKALNQTIISPFL